MGRLVVIAVVLLWAAASVQPLPAVGVEIDSKDLRFDGERALDLAAELALDFPYRHSGAANNRLAAEWLLEKLTHLAGLETYREDFPAVLHSRPVTMTNMIGIRRGTSSRAMVFVAHHDQASTTVQGADNDASGVGTILHLAELFADRNGELNLIFLFADGEEYGMLGARHFIQNYPDPGAIVAAVSLDNIGRYNAYGLHLAPVSQGAGYSDLNLIRLTQAVAEEVGVWRPEFPAPAFQVVERAVALSFTDQGPFVRRPLYPVPP